ncbi:MAG TPA: pseudaminic acid synthase [Alphaproteobacteria bacterium]|jgi:N-acetylneuraminate synthase|nr:pseudaminic acid synthase [Alphaproteobacteria bacterium]
MFSLAGRPIGAGSPPFVIAEMSGNHNRSLDRALAIVDAAADAGAHAIKLQTYTADTLTIDAAREEFTIADEGSLWKGRNLYELYQEAYTPWEWHAPIMERAKARGIVCFSSPFDETAVDFLEGLNAPAYKIASFENVHLPLIRKAASTGKPLIISTGMATTAELDDAVSTARGAGCRDLVLLKCTSTYPATPENTNLATIPDMRARYGCEIGLSDHTMGVGASVAAVALGATVIEKHFTLARADGGVDSAFSLEPSELKSLVVETGRAALAMGKVSYGPTEAETKSLRFRRSLFAVRDIAAGEALTADNVRIIRPGHGLPPKEFDRVIGRRARARIARGTPLSWDLIA